MFAKQCLNDNSLKERYKGLYNLLKGTISSNLKHIDLLKLVGVEEIYNFNPKAKENTLLPISAINQSLARWRKKKITLQSVIEEVSTNQIGNDVFSSDGSLLHVHVSVSSSLSATSLDSGLRFSDPNTTVTASSTLPSSSSLLSTTASQSLTSSSASASVSVSVSDSNGNDNQFVPSRFFSDFIGAPKEAPPLLLPSNANSKSNNTPSIASLTNIIYTCKQSTKHQSIERRTKMRGIHFVRCAWLVHYS